MKKKIIVQIAEGLGNQLFMYAHAYSIAKKLNYELFIDNKSGKLFSVDPSIENVEFRGKTYKNNYLNNVNDGGTRFTNFNIDIEAIEGRLVLWSPYWTHIHHGIISSTKTKYIATGWYSFVDQ